MADMIDRACCALIYYMEGRRHVLIMLIKAVDSLICGVVSSTRVQFLLEQLTALTPLQCSATELSKALVFPTVSV